MRRSVRVTAALVPPLRHHRRIRCGPGARRCLSQSSSTLDPAAASAANRTASRDVASATALAQQQLSFCCLLCGWDSACRTCPFDWYGFDPRRFRRQQRQRRAASEGGGVATRSELAEALATLGLQATDARGVSAQEVKAAFRAKALEWHPDCSAHEHAEETFKGIVRAYELLLGGLPP
ncbi:hypothetical protein PybrP1_007173 [[Pythium] brassicae (nom. inval.)]|nr:hypothetical protein PybrP1_007173 [[Pythium] brassicae (nom. inval.)]